MQWRVADTGVFWVGVIDKAKQATETLENGCFAPRNTSTEQPSGGPKKETSIKVDSRLDRVGFLG